MALYGALSKHNLLDEFSVGFEIDGVLKTPTQLRDEALQNLTGASGLTAAEVAQLDGSILDSLATGAGSGVAGAESYAAGVVKAGGLYKTQIVIDLTGLIGSATDLDIIGDSAAANAHIGQVTAALNGTFVAGSITCLEVPTGGPDDVDFYSADEGTLAQDAAITSGTNDTALVTSGAAWTLAQTKAMTGLPAADQFLYVVNGEGAAGGAYTAGKFLIELYGK